MLAGVCGGIAEYFNVDPTIVRLIWIFLAMVTAFVGAFIAYLICAIVIPAKVNDYNNPTPDDQ